MKLRNSPLGVVALLCFPALGWSLPLSEYNEKPGDTLELFVAGSHPRGPTRVQHLQRSGRSVSDGFALIPRRSSGEAAFGVSIGYGRWPIEVET
jgi:hypothetical protein